MKAAKFGVALALFAVLVVFGAASARADLYWEYENRSKGIPHQQDGTKIQKQYLSAAGSRVEPGDGKVIIMDFGSMIAYTLNPQNRSYTQLDLNQPIGLPEGMSPADKEKMGKLMGGMMQIKVSATEEVKTIEGYKCRKYIAEMPMVQGVYWVSKDVKGYQELRSIGLRLAKAAEKNPMLRQMNIASMMDQMDGFPVQMTNNVMGGTITSTLKKVEQRPLPPDLFRVPKDFSMKGR